MYLTDENLVGCGSGGKWSQAKKWSPYKKVQVPGEQWVCGNVREYVQNSYSRFLHQRIRASFNYDPKF